MSALNVVEEWKADLKDALGKGVFHLFLSLGFTQGMAFILGMALAIILGPANLGHIKVIQVILQFAAIPAGFGMNSAIVKFVSEFPSEQRKKAVFSQAILLSLATSLAVALILFILAGDDWVIKDSVARHYLRFLCWTVPFAVLATNVLGYFQGRKQIKKLATVSVIQQALMLVVVLGLTRLWLLDGFAAAKFGYTVFSGLALAALAGKDFKFIWDRDLFRRIFKFGGLAQLATSFSITTFTADVICLSAILEDPALVGYYGVAIAIARGLMIIPTAITSTALPYLSERRSDPGRIRQMLFRLGKKLTLVMGCICLLLFFLAPRVVGLVFGERYLPSVKPLRVLMPWLFAASLRNLVGSAVIALERPDISFYNSSVGVAVNITLNIILINSWGMIGAAYATLLTDTLKLGTLIFWLWFFVFRKRRRH